MTESQNYTQHKTDIMITKKMVEEILGYEINDFKVMPPEHGVIDVYVVPKRGIQHINLNITILPTGVKFEE